MIRMGGQRANVMGMAAGTLSLVLPGCRQDEIQHNSSHQSTEKASNQFVSASHHEEGDNVNLENSIFGLEFTPISAEEAATIIKHLQGRPTLTLEESDTAEVLAVKLNSVALDGTERRLLALSSGDFRAEVLFLLREIDLSAEQLSRKATSIITELNKHEIPKEKYGAENHNQKEREVALSYFRAIVQLKSGCDPQRVGDIYKEIMRLVLVSRSIADNGAYLSLSPLLSDPNSVHPILTASDQADLLKLFVPGGEFGELINSIAKGSWIFERRLDAKLRMTQSLRK